MATKLYPPLIEGTIPAFCGTTLVVPFSLNRAVALSEIVGFVLKIKTVQGNLLDTIPQTDPTKQDLTTSIKSVSFDVSNIVDKLQIGQYYKIQIAFLSAGTSANMITGYFSTVGVVKYTTKPTLYIEKLSTGVLNQHLYTYTVAYGQYGKDTTEKLYSTRFVLTDSKNNILVDSGELLHNTNEDVNSYESSESFTISQDLNSGESYYLKATIQTSNGLTLSTNKYRLIQGSTISSELHGWLDVINNFEDGYVQVNLVGDQRPEGGEYPCSGTFILSKAMETEDYIWHDVYTFSITDSNTSRELWKDFTVEQGVTYRYSIQEINSSNIRSERIISADITANFEDAFLYDGKRQLKIRYNPKVTSFKTDLQESKMETIGSQYPFIFRNGNIYYKEFPISGLISYKMDENEWFTLKEDIFLEDETFDLTANNIYAERNFKMQVLEWLNDGRVKLFRSPGEGNFIIRLMNISLSPQDALGRMLHTFTSTAYEIDAFTYDNLVNHNLLSSTEASFTITQWATVELASKNSDLDTLLSSIKIYVNAQVPIIVTQEQHSRICNALPEFNNSNYFTPYGEGSWMLTEMLSSQDIAKLESIINTVTYVSGQINTHPICHLDIRDMLPGTLIGLQSKINSPLEYLQIGVTGAYSATFEEPIVGVYVLTEQDNKEVLLTGIQGSITLGYKTSVATTFSLIEGFESADVPCRQWIGQPQKTIYNITNSTVYSYDTNNVIEVIEDAKTNIVKIYSMRFSARPIRQIFVKDKNSEGMIDTTFSLTSSKLAYWDMNCTTGNEVDFDNLDEYYVYAVCHARFDRTYESVPYEGYYIYANYNHGYYVDKYGEKSDVFAGYYIDGKSTKDNMIQYDQSVYHNTVTIGQDTIDLTEIEHFTINDYDDTIDKITFDNGVIGELSYTIARKVYSFERTNEQVHARKLDYEAAVERLEALREYMNIKNPTDAQKATYAYKFGISFNNIPTADSDFIALEKKFVNDIALKYQAFIYLVQTTLYSYKKEIES